MLKVDEALHEITNTFSEINTRQAQLIEIQCTCISPVKLLKLKSILISPESGSCALHRCMMEIFITRVNKCYQFMIKLLWSHSFIREHTVIYAVNDRIQGAE